MQCDTAAQRCFRCFVSCLTHPVLLLRVFQGHRTDVRHLVVSSDAEAVLSVSAGMVRPGL